MTVTDAITSYLDHLAVERGTARNTLDGYARDRAEIEAVGLPVFCRGETVAAAPKAGPGEVNVPVACGDVVVCPGDVVVGDLNGVVVVPQEAVRQVLAKVQPG